MATVKPRVIVTLEPEAYEVLRGMARLGNTTPGRVLTQVALPVFPALKRLVEASESFAAWQRDLHGQLEGVHQEVRQGVEGAIQAMEAAMGVVGAAGAPLGLPEPQNLPQAEGQAVAAPARSRMRRRSAPGAAEAGNGGTTPPTNRGVKRSSRVPAQPSKATRKGGRP